MEDSRWLALFGLPNCQKGFSLSFEEQYIMFLSTSSKENIQPKIQRNPKNIQNGYNFFQEQHIMFRARGKDKF